MADLSDAKRRIIEMLKRAESATAHELAGQFNTTTTAVRQHLDALEHSGLVERFEGPISGRGRPAIRWRTTPISRELFPDRHSELTVELLGSIRASLGDDALDRVIEQRAAQQLAGYRAALDDGPVAVRIRRLAERRTDEGYLAEVVADDGDLLLIEHHCPICVAAAACQGLCRSELEVFQAVLGPEVTVTRAQHVLSGDTRCSYRISAVSGHSLADELAAAND
ncbi:MAG: MarR family transcriptional regulator [Ilumatobacteraceae bacterium]|nr:MarR family transcriptional regulator [Ilumatobacteraceae bacterium]